MSYFVNLKKFFVGTEYSSNDDWNGTGEVDHLDLNEFYNLASALDYGPRAYGRSLDEWEIIEYSDKTQEWSLVCRCKRIHKGGLSFTFQ